MKLTILGVTGKTGVKRVIVMSSLLVLGDRLSGFAKLMSGLIKGMVADKVVSEDSLRASVAAFLLAMAVNGEHVRGDVVVTG